MTTLQYAPASLCAGLTEKSSKLCSSRLLGQSSLNVANLTIVSPVRLFFEVVASKVGDFLKFILGYSGLNLVFQSLTTTSLPKLSRPLTMIGFSLKDTSDNLLYQPSNAPLNCEEQGNYTPKFTNNLYGLCETCLILSRVMSHSILPAYTREYQ